MYMGDSLGLAGLLANVIETKVSEEDVAKAMEYINTGTFATSIIPSSHFEPATISVKNQLDEDDIKRLFEEMFKKTKPSVFKLTCQSCGASVEQKLDDHLFKCPYCKSAYYIGTELIRG